MSRPPTHSKNTTGVPKRIVFAKSIFHGVRIVWLARSVMSKPPSPAEESTTIATLSWGGGRVTVDVINGGATGQLELPSLAIQTNPMVAERPGGTIAGT